MTRIFTRIVGTGGYLPKEIRTNNDIAALVDTSDAWIFERTGIRRRHIADPDESVASMAEVAARQALEQAAWSAASLDLIILATSAPDKLFPSTACLLQTRLGATGIGAFDVQAACAGFIYALATADAFIRAGTVRRALVVGSEINSRVIDWSDRSTCILFGDGAGAVLLETADEPGILTTRLHADGSYQDLLYLPHQAGEANPGDRPAYIRMSGNEVFKIAVNTLGGLVQETLEIAGVAAEAVDWLIPHQANIRIIKAAAKKIGLPMERVVLTIEDQGNTSSASIPLSLDQAVRDGRVRRGQMVLMEAFGGGFAWGSALVRY